jgi:3-oxoacyl-[acyl-carrier protein] reductase
MRNVIVTGGSRGLGLGIVRQLAERDYRVIAIARNSSDDLASLMKDANARNPGSVQFVSCDLGEIDKLPELVKGIRKENGPIYALINNAAIALDGALAMLSNTDIERLVRLNTLSPIILTKYVVRSMLAAGEGRIVNVASIIGFTGYSGLSAYGATKASMIGFTRSLAREVGRMGITVNAVAPGFMATDMTHSLTEDQYKQILRRSALRRLPDIGDIASTVEFLLGEGARNITGTVLTVDAGSTA